MILAFNNGTLDETKCKAMQDAIDLDPTLAFCVEALLIRDYTNGDLSQKGQAILGNKMEKEKELRNEIRNSVLIDIKLSIAGTVSKKIQSGQN